ncbi:universal stress protein [uncultured Winogradskyella sp.]|mgnify:CR=1 FL=1|uniref:universal stress protein n=1 Tax=uncultured Winogradskyella sp. TaxID=395353 RepID=UPI002613D639|nr:universal stress protein [uncultured Winogradskyella sp.]|tara:strand:+ start:420 stop:1259 length:840 start_codon:yes stop_codon:yes gene_type:complete
MKHHIILPTDFSDNAFSAALYALKLYNNEQCTFYLLNTWMFTNSGSRTYITSTYLDRLQEETSQKLEEHKVLLEEKSNKANHEFRTIFSKEPLVNTIKKAIKDQDINLIIMGTKGATGAKEFLFGSNTVNIINKVKNCPILVVPDGYEFITPKKIAFPTDYNRFYGEELVYIKQLSKLYNSKITVVHINEKKNLTDKQNYNLAMLKAYLENYKHSFHWMTGFDNKEHAIKEFIKELNINILTMINYKHSFIENITKEPVVKNIGYHPTVPFLVIPCHGD